ncbi:TetR/AcrR family transcriptional regulator [Streptomyces longispororuber]|uniref:TetR/AcrR family transcriptional regulator n=1 Tax=Streptomyces longispororuber TaxID=68230 RepID=UPI002109E0B1|nr:TetR/AcrR family transcriptional regulator [Streptomyces longispororuber]MCQ4210938.1 TetR/AcrR family transcriptional regulator [Streptomyces longispororuber]
MSEQTEPRRRRVQQRALDTRDLLLDTTVRVLAEQGYAQFSTLAVGEAAGVTRGRLVHHFPTKLALVEAALQHLVARYRERVPLRLGLITEGPAEGRIARALDTLWSLKRSREYTACLELIAGARGDDELRDALREFERDLNAALDDAVHGLVGATADRPGFDAALMTTISAMRGLLLTARALGLSEGDLEGEWSRMRERLVLIFEEYDPAGV